MSLYIRKEEVRVIRMIYLLYGDDTKLFWGTLPKIIARLDRERNKGNEKSKLAMQELYYRRHNK